MLSFSIEYYVCNLHEVCIIVVFVTVAVTIDWLLRCVHDNHTLCRIIIILNKWYDKKVNRAARFVLSSTVNWKKNKIKIKISLRYVYVIASSVE